MLLKDLGEFGLIKRLTRDCVIDPTSVIVGIGDDAAAIKVSEDKLLLITTDLLVEKIDFTLQTSTPYQIGWKSLAVNLSDIAAMGGIPTHAFISIGLPPDTSVEFADQIYTGLKDIALKYKVNILGGDVSATPKNIIINVALLGEIEPQFLITRSGARIDEVIVVTGTLGDSAAGLEVLMKKLPLDFLGARGGRATIERQLKPEPRVAAGRILATSGFVNSIIDISDGLASEVHHICESSQVGAQIWLDTIPISKQTSKIAELAGKSPYDLALYGGEDFELLFTCPFDKVDILKKRLKSECQLPITVVGKVVKANSGVKLKAKNGKLQTLNAKGYEHFKDALHTF